MEDGSLEELGFVEGCDEGLDDKLGASLALTASTWPSNL